MLQSIDFTGMCGLGEIVEYSPSDALNILSNYAQQAAGLVGAKYDDNEFRNGVGSFLRDGTYVLISGGVFDSWPSNKVDSSEIIGFINQKRSLSQNEQDGLKKFFTLLGVAQYAFIRKSGGSSAATQNASSSAAPTKSWWDAITAPIGITSTPTQPSGGSAPIRQTQNSVVQSKRPAVDAAAIARQYAQNHPGVNVWTARMPWIIGGIGLVLVVSIALLVGTNEN